MESVYEQFFFLKYSGGWSFAEAYNLPVGLRKWFVDRLLRQLEAEAQAAEDAYNNSSGATTLTAQNAPQMPAHIQQQLGKTQ